MVSRAEFVTKASLTPGNHVMVEEPASVGAEKRHKPQKMTGTFMGTETSCCLSFSGSPLV